METFNETLIQNITTQAKAYSAEYSTDELISLLKYEWAKVEARSAPVRGENKTGLKVFRRIVRKLTENTLIVTATMGAITSDVLTHMDTVGYDLNKYRVPISIMVAIITSSTLETLNQQIVDEEE